MAVNDEPSHAIMAAATALRRPNIAAYYQVTGVGDWATTGVGIVEVPNLYTQLHNLPWCFNQTTWISAACMPEITGELGALLPVTTSAIDYLPVYYAVVGLPALLPAVGPVNVYLMRVVNSAFAAVFLAMAVRTVMEMRRRRWLGAALVLTLTPTAVNLLGSINPQSMEVAGTLLLWVALLALLTEPDPALTARRAARVVLGAALTALSRGMGPFFNTLIVVAVVALLPWERVRAAFADRRAWWALIGGVCVTALGTGWILLRGSLPSGAGGAMTWQEALRHSYLAITSLLMQQIAILGWQEWIIPQWFHLLVAGMIGLVLLLALSLGSARERLVLVLGMAAVVLIPLLVEAYQARIIGPFWQGRYIFPVSMGVLLLAGWVVDNRGSDIPARMSRQVVTLLLGAFAGLQVVTFAFNLQRFVNGVNGSWFRFGPESWVPPAHPVLLTTLYGAVWVALTALLLRPLLSRNDDAPIGGGRFGD